MGFLDLFRSPPPHQDPALGTLKWSGRRWEGRILLPGHGDGPLRISGTPAGPDSVALSIARDLPQRCANLIPAIQTALFEHYEPYRDAVASGEFRNHEEPFPQISSPDEIFNFVQRDFVGIETLDGVLTLEIAYTTTWDTEHTVGARFQNWVFVELCGSVV